MRPSRQARDEARARLVEHGIRATAQRVALLSELVAEPDDATAQTLHERLRRGGERIGLATVYRTLALLVEAGVIDALAHEPGQTCYRLCGSRHHHHLVCMSCHRVVELRGRELDAPLRALAGRHGFATIEQRLELVGLCVPCSERKAA